MIVLGADTHKRTHALAAVEAGSGVVCGQRSITADEPGHLAGLIREGIRHRGYALIDVLQPCVIFNRINTYEWYGRRIYKLEEAGHDPHDGAAAQRAVGEWGDRIPIGVIYRAKDVPTYEDQLPALRAGPLVSRPPTERGGLDSLAQRFL